MKDLNHKLSRKIVNKNDLIVFEKLNTSKMVQSKKVSKWTRDGMLKACWYQLATFTTYKVKETGKWVEFVSPYHTSKMCYECKEVNKTLGDKEIFKCSNPNCDYKEDRDVNASKNILEKGIIKLGLKRLGTLSSERI